MAPLCSAVLQLLLLNCNNANLLKNFTLIQNISCLFFDFLKLMCQDFGASKQYDEPIKQ